MNRKLPYEAPSVEQFAVMAESGLALSQTSGSTTETVSETDYAGSATDFWN